MDLVPRNVGHEPRRNMPDPSRVRARGFAPRRAAACRLLTRILWPRPRLLAAAALACGLAGCQSFGVPLAQWRAGYDSSLAKKITKEEKSNASNETVEEPRTLIQRWLSPKGAEATKSAGANGVPNSKSSSTLVLGSDGWRPMMKPKTDPEADKELEVAMKLFQEGQLADAESAFYKIA